MRGIIGGLACGALFGIGLALGGMTHPSVVLGFLDLAGAWDPSLAFVMAGAVVVTGLGYAWLRRRERPLWADAFERPPSRPIDRGLIGGAALFGIGWGLTGYCPGPAVASLSAGWGGLFVFLLAMLAGMAIVRIVRRKRDAVPATHLSESSAA
jgi:uncharacterized membrane protein YedE/YeeE